MAGDCADGYTEAVDVVCFTLRVEPSRMLPPARHRPPLPFIADHGLIALVKKSAKATLDEQEEWLRPETFRWRRDPKLHDAPTKGLSKNWNWEPVADRTKFLTDLSCR